MADSDRISTSSRRGQNKNRTVARIFAVLFLVLVLLPSSSFAVTQGPLLCATAAHLDRAGSGGGSGGPWVNPGNATVDNGTVADTGTVVYQTTTVYTDYLTMTNCGFSIPAGATIDGVTVEYNGYTSGAGGSKVIDSDVKLVIGVATTGTSQADTVTVWPTVVSTILLRGGAANTWGATLNDTNVNASTFGVAVSVRGNAAKNQIGNIDYARITITYTPVGGTPSVDIEDGTDPTPSAPCQSDTLYLNNFEAIETASAATTITEVQLDFTTYTNISSVIFNSSDDLTTYDTGEAPTSASHNFSLTTPIPVGADATVPIKIYVVLAGGASGTVDAEVTAISLSSGVPSGTYNDTSPAITVDETAPGLSTLFAATSGQSEQVPLGWTNPSDSDLGQVEVRRNTGTYPATHGSNTSVYVNGSATPSGSETPTDTTGPPTNGTTYFYTVFAADTCGNWNDNHGGGSGNEGTGTPSAGSNDTALDDANDGNWTGTIDAPGSSVVTSEFNIVTNAGTDEITSMQVTTPSDGAEVNTIQIWDATGSGVQYYDAGCTGGPTTWNCTGTAPSRITASTSLTVYTIKITWESHAAMTAGTYSVSTRISGITPATNTNSGSDAAGNSFSADNTAPANPTGFTGVASDGQVNFASWSNPGGDFAEIILVNSSAIAVDATPVDGSTYSVNDTFVEGTVKVVGTDTSYLDQPLTNDTAMYYEIFARDTYGNWSTGAAAGPYTPTGATGDVLTGSNVTNATTADPSDTGVLMQKVTLSCSNVDDGDCVLESVWVQDNKVPGATHIDKVQADISTASDCGTVVATGSTGADWDGADTQIALSRTVNNAASEYLCIYYDFEATTASTVQSEVTQIVLDTTGAQDGNDSVSMGTWQSNIFPVGVVETDQFNVIDCNDCHGTQSGTWAPTDSGTRNLPDGAVVGDHTAGTTHVPTGTSASECAVCHGSLVSGYGTAHRTGVINMAATGDISSGSYSRGASFNQSNTVGVTGTCSDVSCHGGASSISPQWGVGSISCDSCHKVNQELSAKHSFHYNTSAIIGNRAAINNSTADKYIFNCGVCHNVDPGSEHADGTNAGAEIANGYTVDIKFDLTAWGASGGAYSNQNDPTTTSVGNFPAWTNGKCSSIYCHSDGKSSPVYKTPVWSDGSLACDGCHGYNATLLANTLTPMHGAHMGTDVYSFDCGECHASTVADDTDGPITGHDYHVNGAANIVFATVGAIDQSGGIYDAGTCSGLYCHSDGLDDGSYTPVTSPAFADGSTSCTSCHSDNADPSLLSLPHARHVDPSPDQSYTCDNCHSLTVANNQTATLAGHTVHVDGIQNLVFSGTGFGSDHYNFTTDLASYNGAQCTNVYCHSLVQAGDGTSAPVFNTVSWSAGSLACDGCHAGKSADTLTMATASHTAHVSGQGYDCIQCHTGGGGTLSANIGNHVDGKITLIINSAFGGTYSEGTEHNPRSGFGTCSSVMCHGTISDTWGTDNSSYYECTQCHGRKDAATDIANSAPGIAGAGFDTSGVDTDPTDAEVGAHNAHVLVPSNIYNSDGVTCDECHPVISSIGDADHITTSLPAEVPLDGAMATNGTATSGGTTYNSGTCTNTYCHDSNYSSSSYGGGLDVAPTWTNTIYLVGTSADCGMCHGNPPPPGHDANADCSSCHLHVNANDISFSNANLHIDGIVQADADCYGCHGGATGGVRQITKAGGDFVRSSRHVSDGTTTEIVTMWDCVVCHLEGNASTTQNNGVTIGDRDPNYHNAGSKTGDQYDVDLRNVDDHAAAPVMSWNPNVTYSTWTTSDLDNFDTFCMNCHDSDGASDISVNATDDGIATPKSQDMPFNSNANYRNVYEVTANIALLLAERDALSAPVNVKDQFNSGNAVGKDWASHHNLSQFVKRYGTKNSTYWPDALWTTQVTRENAIGNGTNIRSEGETAGLHCSDCHLNEVNAHGSVSTVYMLKDSTGSDTQFTDSGMSTSTDNCVMCHTKTDYDMTTSGTNSRFEGHGTDGGRCDQYDSPAGEAIAHLGQTVAVGTKTATATQLVCLGCHGGASFGGIHGDNTTYIPDEPSSGAVSSPRYRFQGNGGSYRWFSPKKDNSYTGEGDWETSGTDVSECYTLSSADAWGSCTAHSTGGKTPTLFRDRPLNY